MDKTLAWLWLADAVGSACQYAQELLALYPDPAELYDLLRAGTEAPPTCLTPRALAQLQDTTPFDFEERLDHCLLSGIELLTPDEDTYPAALRDLLVEHGVECLLLGGQISRSFAYMEAALRDGLRDVAGLTRIAPAEHIGEAAFYGLLAQADGGC